jgi:transposase
MHESPLYAGIDLHSNNSYLCILDTNDKVVYQRRLPNRLAEILGKLEAYRERIVAVAVESTFNWYWLVDGLTEAGYEVQLVNTSAVKQYEGLKHTDDRHDARWLAHLMRLGILPTGYIMPKELRSTRDLLRKRMTLVQQKTANVLSLQNLKQRNEGVRLTMKDLRSLTVDTVVANEPDAHRAMALGTTLEVIMALAAQIAKVETTLIKSMKPNPDWNRLKSIWGVGEILALTIQLETGPIERFSSPGTYASYCRCVKSDRISNGKVKGKGNDKCGNQYLSWAWSEAAHFAVVHYPVARRFHERKAKKTHPVLAQKALAHKLARAGWHILRSGEHFDPNRVFG